MKPNGRLESISPDVFDYLILFLDVRDMVPLSISSTMFYKLFSPERWFQIFNQRWGQQYQLNPRTRISSSFYSMIFSSWFVIALERGFLLGSKESLPPTKTYVEDGLSSSINKAPWKVAAIMRERGLELFRCSTCNELDLTPERKGGIELFESSAEHLCATWLLPCRCPIGSHRSCLEKQITYKQGEVVTFMELNATGDPGAGLPRIELNNKAACDNCNFEYKGGVRLPVNACELVIAMLKDRDTVVYFCQAWFWVFMLLFLSARGERFLGQLTRGEPGDMVLWRTIVGEYSSICEDICLVPVLFWLFLLVQAPLIQIFLSPRFSRTVLQVWQVPAAFRFYVKLYVYCVVTTTITAQTLSPLRHLILSSYLNSYVGTFLAYVNTLTFLPVGLMMVLIFLKTNYRIFTIAPHDYDRASVTSEAQPNHACALCQFRLCLHTQ